MVMFKSVQSSEKTIVITTKERARNTKAIRDEKSDL